jgi:O-antigen/teichoic acid export membrane protein
VTMRAEVVNRPPGAAFSVIQSIAARCLMIGINAATGIVTARALKPEGRGELAALILWPSFLASVMTLGIPSSLIFNIRRDERNAGTYLGAATVLGSLLSIVAMLGGYVGLPWWLGKYPENIVHAAQGFLLVVPFTVFTLIGRGALEAGGKFAASNATWWASQLPTLAGLAVLAETGELTVFRAGLCYVLGGLPVCLWMLNRIRLLWSARFGGLGQAFRILLSYGIRSYGVDLCGTLALYVDQALVIALLAPGAMGNYVVALSLSRLLNVVQQSVTMVLFPKAASLGTEAAVELTGRAARVSTAIAGLGGAMVLLVGPLALRVLYGSDYAGAALTLRILIVEVVLSGCTLVLAQSFMALGRPGVVTVVQCLGLGLSIPLMLVLIPRMGTAGAATALLISTSARLVFTILSFRYFLGVRAPRLWMTWAEAGMLGQELVNAVARKRGAPLPLEAN